MLAFAAITLSAGPASAHPLGNFSINQFHELVVRPDRITDLAVLDIAEIPTLQSDQDVDTDHDGREEPGEMAVYAAHVCGTLAVDTQIRADDKTLSWHLGRAAMEYRPGAAGLRISRITCELTASSPLRAGSDVTFHTGYQTDRVGWKETIAHGDGVALAASDVPAVSISDRLRTYPQDLLGDPLDVLDAHLRVGVDTALTAATPRMRAGKAGLFQQLEAKVITADQGLTAVVTAPRLSILTAALGVLLALLVGAAHAMLPGHGKTVMAACMAGRRGGVRDATIVASTVTITHTAGVFGIGLALALSTRFATERLLSWLAVVSGLMICAAGFAIVLSARRRSRLGASASHAAHQHAHSQHGHQHAGEPHGHTHGHAHHHEHHSAYSRTALVGMGVAGGLVPSPTALLVLLGATAIHRASLGVVLVIAYGLGMAAILASVGLIAAKLGDAPLPPRFRNTRIRHLARLHKLTPIVSATLVTVVGLVLTVQATSSALQR